MLGAPSEPEATSLMVLAFNDAAGRRWLSSAQLPDGSIGLRAGAVFRDVTALAAMALPAGDPREQALDRVLTTAGQNGPDPTIVAAGWPWTDDAHGWVEPTAWGRSRP